MVRNDGNASHQLRRDLSCLAPVCEAITLSEMPLLPRLAGIRPGAAANWSSLGKTARIWFDRTGRIQTCHFTPSWCPSENGPSRFGYLVDNKVSSVRIVGETISPLVGAGLDCGLAG